MQPTRIPRILAVTLPLIATPCAHAANLAYNVPTGNWNSSNWTGGGVPPGVADSGIVRGNRTVTLDQAQGTVINVFLGEDTGFGTLLFNPGGSLALTGSMDVMRRGNYPNAVGTFTMTGGTLSIAGTMFVGAGGALNTGTSSGTATISGGTYTGAISIGSTTASTSVGSFNVVGAAASIGDGGVAKTFAVNQYGTLGFTLGAIGVSTLNYAASAVSFASGSAITVDGSSYTGGAGDLVLINGGGLTGTAAGSITGFTGFNSELVYDEGGSGDLVLRLTSIPEPRIATLGLVGLVIGVRRKRARAIA